jgi:hypothetical protein
MTYGGPGEGNGLGQVGIGEGGGIVAHHLPPALPKRCIPKLAAQEPYLPGVDGFMLGTPQ